MPIAIGMQCVANLRKLSTIIIFRPPLVPSCLYYLCCCLTVKCHIYQQPIKLVS